VAQNLSPAPEQVSNKRITAVTNVHEVPKSSMLRKLQMRTFRKQLHRISVLVIRLAQAVVPPVEKVPLRSYVVVARWNALADVIEPLKVRRCQERKTRAQMQHCI